MPCYILCCGSSQLLAKATSGKEIPLRSLFFQDTDIKTGSVRGQYQSRFPAPPSASISERDTHTAISFLSPSPLFSSDSGVGCATVADENEMKAARQHKRKRRKREKTGATLSCECYRARRK
jgi:hypothetical protein